MKNLYLSFILVLSIILELHSQYRCIPSIQEHGNPGVPNSYISDFQNHSFYFSTNPTNVVSWQAVRQIGFPFYFNGALVTAFKTTDNGILTFDTTASAVAPSNNLLLPNANVPNKSICIRGGRPANGYTNVVVTQTINNNLLVPSKQLWISFICLVDSGSIHRQLWSIVLEENTNNIYVVNQWRNTSVPGYMNFTVGLQIDGSTAYLAPGSPFIHGEAGEGGASSDNYYYAFIPESPLSSDGSVTGSNLSSYLSVERSPYIIGAKFKNLGTDTVTSLSLHYSVNGGSAITQNFIGLNLPSGFSQWLSFNNTFAPSVPGTYQIDYWCDNLSAGIDGDTSNNHFSQTITVAQALPLRRPVMEEFKGTWCPSAGYWTQKYDTLLKSNLRFASSIHYEESYVNWTYDRNQISERETSVYGGPYIPLSIANGAVIDGVDRGPTAENYFGCPWNLNQPLIDSLIQLNGLFFIHPYLSVVQDSIVHIQVAATAATTLAANSNCRLYTALVEDTITSATNFYPGNSNEKLLVNTVRIMFPSYSSGIHQVSLSTADTGVFIGHPIAGHVDSFSYTYVISDTTCKASRLYVVAFIQDTLTKEIYQSAQSDMPFVGLGPRSDFNAVSTTRICAGNQVSFQNKSLCGSTYKWLFPGGVPASNTAITPPAITYQGPGNYDVTLIATNQYGSDTFIITQYVMVMDTTITTVSADFEGSDLLPSKWWCLPSELAWYVDSNASGYGIGKRSVVSDINNYTLYRETNLVLPQMNFRHSSHPYLKYDYAYLKSSFPAYVYNDTLQILVSKDCGATFDTVYFAGSDSLRTERGAFAYAYPDSSQWKTREIDLTAYSGENNIQIVFRYEQYPLSYTTLRLDNIQIDQHLSPPAISFTASSQNICVGDTITFQNTTSDATNYQWLLPGGNQPSTSVVNPQVVYNTTGIWPVTLIASNSGYTDTLLVNSCITVNAPLQSSITNDTTKCNNAPLVLDAGSGFSAHEWSTGESSQTITINNGGTYFLITTDANGCNNTDTIVVQSVICSGITELQNWFAINLFPNPANDKLFIVSNGALVTEIKIYNTTGTLLMAVSPSTVISELSIGYLFTGVYIAEITTKEASVRKRWVKM